MGTMPKRSPLEILKLFGDALEATLVVDGYKCTMEGPTLSPSAAWAPVLEEDDGTLWFCSGEPGDPITEADFWVEG